MFVLRTKLAIGTIIVEWLSLLFVAVSIYLAIIQPLFYILVGLCVILFLFVAHKSNYVILKKDGVVYRKYWIWKKLRYDKIKVLFITKHSFAGKGYIYDFHDKNTKQISGCIFLMKDITPSAKNSLSNSVKMSGEWSSTLIDFQYKNEILKVILAGGFDGEIYITDEMDGILGTQLRSVMEENNFDTSKIKVLQTN